MLADGCRQLGLAHTALADGAIQGGFCFRWSESMVLAMVGTAGDAVGAIHFILLLDFCTLGGDGGGRPEADALREENTRIVAGEGAGAGQFVGVAIGVEEIEGHFGPLDLSQVVTS